MRGGLLLISIEIRFQYIEIGFHYSYRNASTGLSFAACHAG